MIAGALLPFGTTIFSEMTRLANEHGAINLAQGFPNFQGPPELYRAARAAMDAGENQYSRSLGHPALVAAIAAFHERQYGLVYDAETEVAVTCGATEGIAAALLGLLDPGDEAILIEPFYDSYPALVARAGAVARFATLRYPSFDLPRDEIAKLFGPRTKILVLNTPHNPSGKVFRRDELEFLAELCRRHGVIVLSDEVYEHITFDGAAHIPMAALDGMKERTVTLSSAGKTFSLTGWKVGWATGPAALIAGVQAAHQFLTFCAATPLQVAVAAALRGLDRSYYDGLRADYRERRDLLLAGLEAAGFRPVAPRGTYFILADFSTLSARGDREFARELATLHGVAAIPPSVFYQADPAAGSKLLRFAFCKTRATLEEAIARLAKVRGRSA